MEDGTATAVDKWQALKVACDSHGEQLQRVLSGQAVHTYIYIARQCIHAYGYIVQLQRVPTRLHARCCSY